MGWGSISYFVATVKRKGLCIAFIRVGSTLEPDFLIVHGNLRVIFVLKFLLTRGRPLRVFAERKYFWSLFFSSNFRCRYCISSLVFWTDCRPDLLRLPMCLTLVVLRSICFVTMDVLGINFERFCEDQRKTKLRANVSDAYILRLLSLHGGVDYFPRFVFLTGVGSP